MAKPIPEQLYKRYLKILGLRLEKGSISYAPLKLCMAKERKERFPRTALEKQRRYAKKWD